MEQMITYLSKAWAKQNIQEIKSISTYIHGHNFGSNGKNSKSMTTYIHGHYYIHIHGRYQYPSMCTASIFRSLVVYKQFIKHLTNVYNGTRLDIATCTPSMDIQMYMYINHEIFLLQCLYKIYTLKCVWSGSNWFVSFFVDLVRLSSSASFVLLKFNIF